MTRKLQITFILLLLTALAISGMAFQAAAPFFQIDTPTPEPDLVTDDEDMASTIAQAAKSDGITFLGILIFLIILAPLLMLRKNW